MQGPESSDVVEAAWQHDVLPIQGGESIVDVRVSWSLHRTEIAQ